MSGSKPRKNWKCVNPKCDANLNPTTKSPKLSTKWFYRPTGISSVFPHAKAEEVEYCCRSCSDKHRKIKQDEHANALRPKLRSRRHVAAPVPKFSDKVVDGCKRELERLAGDRSPCDISIQVSATPFTSIFLPQEQFEPKMKPSYLTIQPINMVVFWLLSRLTNIINAKIWFLCNF